MIFRALYPKYLFILDVPCMKKPKASSIVICGNGHQYISTYINLDFSCHKPIVINSSCTLYAAEIVCL